MPMTSAHKMQAANISTRWKLPRYVANTKELNEQSTDSSYD